MARVGLGSNVFTFFLLGLVVLVGVILIRTLSVKPLSRPFSECKPIDDDFIPASQKVIDRFRAALRFRTVSVKPGDYNREELLKFRKFITKEFPIIHSSPAVKFEVISNYSLLYTLKGSNQSLKPYLLAGHLDVVPADPKAWEVPPFSGDIKDGYIYGRGTIDDKHQVMGILHALEYLLKAGFRPKRTLIVAFGHDEEVSGHDGAAGISKVLTERGVQLEYLIDEGTTVSKGVVQGMTKPVAIVGCSEKGFLMLKLSVNGKPSHSSMPPKETTIGILANAVARLESSPLPSKFGLGPERGMMEHLAPEMPFFFKLIMTNLWLFAPLVSRILGRTVEGNAMVRTTTAVTEFHAGIKNNVIPPSAWATVNHRIHPAQTMQEVIDYDKQIINDDRVTVEVAMGREAHPISAYDDDTFGYQTIKMTIHQIFAKEDVVVVPGTMIANTDTAHYLGLTSHIYRFAPTVLHKVDIPRFHGDNERISIKNFEQVINFYYHLIKNSDTEQLSAPHSHTSEL